MKKKFLELPIHHRIFFVTFALTVLSAGTFAGIFYAQKAFTSPAPSSPANFRMPPDPSRMRGEASGIGTHFAITNSEYLNITLESTETVDIKLTSIPKVITMMINPVATVSVATTQITISGLAKNTTYYKYENDYHHLTEFTSDDNGAYSYSQDISVRHFVFIQTRKSTKFIADTGGDCATIGNWNQSTKTCTLTTDITQTISIDGNGITLDGNGHTITITPEYTATGVHMSSKTGITVKNLTIRNAGIGIVIHQSDHGFFRKNILANNGMGIYLAGGYNVIDDRNTVSDSISDGIYLTYADGNTIKDNTVRNGSFGVIFDESYGNRIQSNTIEENGMDVGIVSSDSSVCNNAITGNIGSGGRPIGFFNSPATLNSGTFSELILCNADGSNLRNVTVKGSASKRNNGFFVLYTDRSNFTDMTSDDDYFGMAASDSNGNTFKNITVGSNARESVSFRDSDSNVINGLSLHNEYPNISLLFADRNEFDGTASNKSPFSINLYGSDSNAIHHFNVSVCNINGAGNSFYNNNVGNSCYVTGGSNTFNLPKPVGGNSWGSYDMPEDGCNNENNDSFCDAPYVFSGGQDNLPKSGKVVMVAVILSELSDAPHISSSVFAQPCKLIPAKTYPNGHNKTYYDDMMFCVRDYYRENSYGTVNVEYTVFPTWYKLTKPTSYYIDNEEQFVKDAIEKTGINLSGYDIVSAIHSGNSMQLPTANDLTKLSTRAFYKRDNPIPFPPFALVVAENDPLGAITHEIGHNLGSLSINQTLTADLYGEVGNMNEAHYGPNTDHFAEWDLMGEGGLNHLAGMAIGTSPSQMGSYTKEFLGWLTPEIHAKSEYKTYNLTPLEFQNFGDKTFHYNLSETTAPDTGIYYLIEARKKDALKTWSATNPSDPAIILYRVNTYDHSPYGDGGLFNKPNSYRMTVNIRDVLAVGETYPDPASLLKFTYKNTSSVPPYLASVMIASTTARDFSEKMSGIKLQAKEAFQDWWWGVRNLLPCLGECKGDVKTVVMNWTIDFIPVGALLLIIFGTIFLIVRIFRKCFLSGLPRAKRIFAKIALMILLLVFTAWFLITLGRYGILLLIIFGTIFLIVRIFRKCFLSGLPRAKRIFAKIALMILLLVFTAWFCIALIQYGHVDRFISVFNPSRNVVYFSSLADIPFPDLDLHAITPDGRHIGMNYSTAKFENQIAGSEVSGDMQGDEEWIFVPSTETVRYYVSSHDTQAFFDANPDIASQVPDKTDKYELYARTIDPATGIFTGATVSQTILPGTADFYQITGTTTPSVIQTSASAKDLISLFRFLVSSINMPKPLRQILLSETNIVEKLLAKNLKKPALALIQSEKRMIQLFSCGTKKTDIFAGMLSEKNALNFLTKDGVDKTDITGMNGLFNQFGRSQKCGLAQSDAELLLGILGKLEGVIKK